MSFRSVLLFSVLLLGYLYWSLAQPTSIIEIRCRFAEQVKDVSLCEYGFYENRCRKNVCYKGPGQSCGEDSSSSHIRNGRCATGLQCCNGYCKGCLDGNCYNVPCYPTHAVNLRSDPYMPERHMDPLYSIFGYYNTE